MAGVFTHNFDNESFKGQVTINTGLFIDGKWVEGSGGTTIEYATPCWSLPHRLTLFPQCPQPYDRQALGQGLRGYRQGRRPRRRRSSESF
jgi:hypothetical protein